MDMVSIDFLTGCHGNFLEYACNRFIVGLPEDVSPFNHLGASHTKTDEYHRNAMFLAGHFTQFNTPLYHRIIKISIEPGDLLLVATASLLRGGELGIKSSELEHNTYFKLLEFQRSDIIKINQSYTDISLTAETPDCPRYILREYFKFGYQNPADHGIMKWNHRLVYSESHNVFDFGFSNFYNNQMFLKKMQDIAEWYNSAITDINGLEQLHQEFLKNQPFRYDKQQCDSILQAVQELKDIEIPSLTLFQESYINGVLESIYNKEMPFRQNEYFKNTNEIINHLCLK